jgi:hypothetical protein
MKNRRQPACVVLTAVRCFSKKKKKKLQSDVQRRIRRRRVDVQRGGGLNFPTQICKRSGRHKYTNTTRISIQQLNFQCTALHVAAEENVIVFTSGSSAPLFPGRLSPPMHACD